MEWRIVKHLKSMEDGNIDLCDHHRRGRDGEQHCEELGGKTMGTAWSPHQLSQHHTQFVTIS